ncbi:MAG: RNA 2',3'-cyclic phosphodiesterase [Pseudomonadales bacterium]|nr:RNA 2',3'-cyclic phosphodiesterase [Pseudomonadales bacterium]
MRLFLAIPLPKAIQVALKNLQPSPAVGLSLPFAENMHITLAFIGNSNVAEVEKALQHFSAKSLSIKPEELGVFKGRKRSTLWAGLEPDQNLFYLRENLTSCLQRRNIHFDPLTWQPHITLARCSTVANASLMEEFLSQAFTPIESFQAREFVLYNSTLKEGLKRYEMVAHYPLKGLS